MTGRCKQRQTGMTLIEVLVAFAIIAGLAISVLALIGQNARYMLTAEERLLASVAADNLLTIDLAGSETPSPGESNGAIEISSRAFDWRRTVLAIEDRGVFIEYSVSVRGEPQTLARASALKESQ